METCLVDHVPRNQQLAARTVSPGTDCRLILEHHMFSVRIYLLDAVRRVLGHGGSRGHGRTAVRKAKRASATSLQYRRSSTSQCVTNA